eukprot:4851-Heterococcus_DN1.PRE.1
MVYAPSPFGWLLPAAVGAALLLSHFCMHEAPLQCAQRQFGRNVFAAHKNKPHTSHSKLHTHYWTVAAASYVLTLPLCIYFCNIHVVPTQAAAAGITQK